MNKSTGTLFVAVLVLALTFLAGPAQSAPSASLIAGDWTIFTNGTQESFKLRIKNVGGNQFSAEYVGPNVRDTKFTGTLTTDGSGILVSWEANTASTNYYAVGHGRFINRNTMEGTVSDIDGNKATFRWVRP